MQRLREICDIQAELLDGVGDVDETYIGGKAIISHEKRRSNHGKDYAMKDKKAEILEEVGKLIKKAGSHKPETPLRSPYSYPSAAEPDKKLRLT